MFNFKPVLYSAVNLDGTSIIYIQYYYQGQKHMLPTKLKIEAKHFDKKNCRVKKSFPDNAIYNTVIGECLGRLHEISSKYLLAKVDLTPDLIKKEYTNPSSGMDFAVWAHKEIDRKVPGIKESTAKAMKSVVNKFNNFAPGIKFSEINHDTIVEFDKYMRKSKNKLSTMETAHKKIKEMLKLAQDHKLILANPYENFKIKHKSGSARVHLDENEVARLLSFYDGSEITDRDKKYLRGFLFGCFTGLRYGDITSIKRSQIFDKMLVYSPIKSQNVNAKIIQLPLNKVAIKLISDSSTHYSQPIFKIATEAKSNKNLKRIVSMVGITKHVTNHVARHTFATLFYERTNDVLVLQKLLGHGNIRETMIYTHVSDKNIIKKMQEFDNEII